MESNLRKVIFNTASGLAAVAATASPVSANVFFITPQGNHSSAYGMLIVDAEDTNSICRDVVLGESGYSFSYAANKEEVSNLSLNARQVIDESNSALDVNDIVAKVKSVFGLNGVQMSQALRVSRPTLYNHLKHNEFDQSVERYQELYELANIVSENVEGDIRKGLKSVLIDGKTLFGYLREENLDHGKVLEVSKLISEKLSNYSKLSREKLVAKDQIRSSRSVSKFG